MVRTEAEADAQADPVADKARAIALMLWVPDKSLGNDKLL